MSAGLSHRVELGVNLASTSLGNVAQPFIVVLADVVRDSHVGREGVEAMQDGIALNHLTHSVDK